MIDYYIIDKDVAAKALIKALEQDRLESFAEMIAADFFEATMELKHGLMSLRFFKAVEACHIYLINAITSIMAERKRKHELSINPG